MNFIRSFIKKPRTGRGMNGKGTCLDESLVPILDETQKTSVDAGTCYCNGSGSVML